MYTNRQGQWREVVIHEVGPKLDQKNYYNDQVQNHGLSTLTFQFFWILIGIMESETPWKDTSLFS